MEGHTTEITAPQALGLLAELSHHIPPCGVCESQACVGWFGHYIHWALSAITNPEGPMAMLLVLLAREENGKIIFTEKELEEARLYKQVLVEKHLVTGELVVQLIDKREVPDTEWPQLLNDNGRPKR